MTHPASSERRKHPRVSLNGLANRYYCDITLDAQNYRAVMLDMSDGGVRLQSDEVAQKINNSTHKNRTLLFKPLIGEQTGDSFKIPGLVRWITGNQFGVQFAAA